jgi:hypothetical protein
LFVALHSRRRIVVWQTINVEHGIMLRACAYAIAGMMKVDNDITEAREASAAPELRN